MRKIIFLLLLCFSNIMALAQDTTLFNGGSIIYIDGNATVQINGDFINEAGSSYVNYGTVTLTGDFTNNQTMASPFSGILKFDGSTRQFVKGAAILRANNVEINNATGVELQNTLQVEGEISFINGIVSSNNSSTPLHFTNSGSISSTKPASDTSHVLGYVVKEGTGAFTYPVGDSAKYQKVTVNLSANSAGMMVNYDTTDAGLAPYATTGSDTTALFIYEKVEHWNISPIGTATGTVSIYWDNYRNGGISDISHLRVAHKSGGNWLNEGTTGVGTIAAGSVTSNSISTWSPFALGSISYASPLPIQLLSFEGTAYKGYNVLGWTVANESGMNSYELQRSSDGIQYQSCGKFVAQNLLDNKYQHTDTILFSGDIYYRLKMNAINNQTNYSNTIRFHLGTGGSESIVFPNPAQDNIFLSVGSDALQGSKACLYDMQGRRIQEITVNSKMVNINISYCAAGTYILRLANGEVFHIIKSQN